VDRIVVMGVSGCGKTTIAQALAAQLGLKAMDADDLHPSANVSKMRAGQPLDDADRWPWLDAVAGELARADDGLVVACSALKRSYRDRMRAHNPGLVFLFLDGPPELIRERMAQREHAYMPTGLLDSQLDTLERPAADERDVARVDLALPIEGLIAQARASLDRLNTPSSP